MKKNSQINSPCIGTCTISGKYCIGCFRTIKEIESWSKLSYIEKNNILSDISKERNLIKKVD